MERTSFDQFTSASNGRENGDLIPILEGRVQPLQETDVIPIDVDVKCTPKPAIVIPQPLRDSGIGSLHLVQEYFEAVS